MSTEGKSSLLHFLASSSTDQDDIECSVETVEAEYHDTTLE